ncbi:MAG: glycosyltransferase, partial [Actinomycetota bacterium]
LERVRRSHPAARLTMAGPDKGARVEVEDEVARRGLGEHVELRGFVGPDEKLALFADHDLFLNTPAVDNRPVCLVEAGASGLVIVSTDAGGIPALVAGGESAMLAPVDDADALADAVVEVLDDPDLARRLSRGGLAVAGEGRPARVLTRWNDLLDDLLPAR